MPFLTVPEQMGTGDFGITAVLGYAVVFFGLVLLMVVVTVIGKMFATKKTPKAEVPVAEPVQQAAPEAPKTPAPGAAGEVKLHNVDPKTAAMLMAIVADKMQKPINELRFISIKEVEQK